MWMGYDDPHVEGARFRLHYGDLTDSSNLTRILSEVEPDEAGEAAGQYIDGTFGGKGRHENAAGDRSPDGHAANRSCQPGDVLPGR